ncbi:hypothetical protein PUMCH_003621 [Australozyma saopauloensis]|uniref:Transcription initiation factor TFIID subunit 8 n=1 Tax=Australozyma saopauloensis TaxID=291208 RepID=A0AAX4HDB2_9ASCO|nr:hypothetical protein PUMCH_003621 [[Candida] saopauloensis]
MPRLTRAAASNSAASEAPAAATAVSNLEMSGPKMDEKSASEPQSKESPIVVPEKAEETPVVKQEPSDTPVEILASSAPLKLPDDKFTPVLSKPKTTSTPPQFRTVSESAYIPPHQRRLGEYLAKVELPHAMANSANVIDFELQKLVGLIVKSSPKNPAFSAEYIHEVTDLSIKFMDLFCTTLRKLTDLQRHSLPGVADLELCLQKLDISPADLHTEYIRHKSLPNSVRQQAARLKGEVDHLLSEYNAEKYDLHKDDPSLVFYTNEQYEIAALVPQQMRSRDYIPEYFPELPPDFTYRLTSSFMDTTLELKKIKMKLFEESRLNESSLHKLIDDDEKRWLEELNEQLAEDSEDDSADENEDIMSVGGENLSEIESPLPDLLEHELKAIGDQDHGTARDILLDGEKVTPDDKKSDAHHNDMDSAKVINEEAGDVQLNMVNASLSHSAMQTSVLRNSVKNDAAFDFVSYARKRKLALEKPHKDLERQKFLRSQNYYLQAEKKFSCYATDVPTKADFQWVDGILDRSFKNVIRATRRAEKVKAKRLAAMEAERKSLEKANEKMLGTLEFAFNEASNFLDESDDNMENEFENFDFGDVIDHPKPVSANIPLDLTISSLLSSGPPESELPKGSAPTSSISQEVNDVPLDEEPSEKKDPQSIKLENDDDLEDMFDELETLQETNNRHIPPVDSESEEDDLEDL